MIRLTRITISYLVTVAVLCCGLSRAASNAEPTPAERVAYAVRYLQPRLSLVETDRIAGALMSVSAEGCEIPWQILLSVAFQESSLRRAAVGKLNPHTTDYGLMQINAKNVLRRGLDKTKLMTDERYALSVGCAILEEAKESHGDRPYWIGLYRAGTAVWKPRTVKIATDYHRAIMKRAVKLGLRR